MPVWYNPFGSLSANDIWVFANRVYNLAHGTGTQFLVNGGVFTPTEGRRYYIACAGNQWWLQYFDGAAWQTTALEADAFIVIYQHQDDGTLGTLRLLNNTGGWARLNYSWEQVNP